MGLGAKIDWLSVFPEESEVQIERERAGGRSSEQEDGIPRTDDHQGVKLQPVPFKAVMLGGK